VRVCAWNIQLGLRLDAQLRRGAELGDRLAAT